MKLCRPRFRLIHLLLFLTCAAGMLWYATQYHKKRCVAVVKKYRLIDRSDGQSLQIQFSFSEPQELAGQSWDVVVGKLPVEHFPKSIQEGEHVVFRFQEEATWFYDREAALEKFWKTLMLNEARMDAKVAEDLFAQIF